MLIDVGELIAFHCPRWDELPAFELYIDQVIAFLSEKLAIFAPSAEEPVITQAMINNYVKQGVMNAPVKKKYDREHLAKLTVICVLKRVLPMKHIADSIAAMQRVFTVQEGYDVFCSELEYSVRSAASPVEYPPVIYTDARSRDIAAMRVVTCAVAEIAVFDKLVALRKSLEPEIYGAR